MSKVIVLAGGRGFLGGILQRFLLGEGFDVVVLSRSATKLGGGVTVVRWDGRTLGDWRNCIDGAHAVVNLSGRSVNCRYNRRNRRDIIASRVESTRVLGEAIAGCKSPPAVWLNLSTATIYKHSLERPMDEETGEIGATRAAKDAFSVDVALAWERAFDEASTPATRKVLLRAAMVLSKDKGGVLEVLRRLVRLRLGGAMAGGDQYVSWIHGDDFCAAVRFLIERDDMVGPVNVSSPQPLTNRELMRALRRRCGVRIGLPATRWMLEVGAFILRTQTELVIKSRRVVPGKLLASGCRFEFPDIETALADILDAGHPLQVVGLPA